MKWKQKRSTQQCVSIISRITGIRMDSIFQTLVFGTITISSFVKFVHSGNGAHSSQSLVVDTIIDGLSKSKYKPMKKTALRTISTKRGAEGIHIMAPLRQKAKDLLIGKSDKRIKALKATIKTMKNT
mmetsp:Transcript_29604/g.33939  ORF Transcript_29604/g.33939 Transcript_29604/m.33939 type:complete len:127 (+) Transcript_29604:191-571(+)